MGRDGVPLRRAVRARGRFCAADRAARRACVMVRDARQALAGRAVPASRRAPLNWAGRKTPPGRAIRGRRLPDLARPAT
ncbi:hypothetical protein BVI434_4570003 [Burkholderia vietnamiensis]|nr:hypothetical protein BVI434_4570003 [Burkholderia vietnamiensis]